MRYLVLLLTFISFVSGAQTTTLSPNKINYQVTYDNATAKYTVWVVPRYSTPNSNNTSIDERGSTAQVSLVVPANFSITNITDVKGSWDKTPLKLGPGNPGQDWSSAGLSPMLNYYTIGKSPVETSYGQFTANTPVALFTFQGNNCLGNVSILANGDPFIAAADRYYSLNVGSSFYSRSGQPSSQNLQPLEQFAGVAGNAAACSINLTATDDALSAAMGQTKRIQILVNDVRNTLPVQSTDVTVSIASNPANGTVVINPDGTLSYTPNANYQGQDCFTYRICDKTQPSLCSTARVCVNVSGSLQQTDIAVTKTANKATAQKGDKITFTIDVNNLGLGLAENVLVQDLIPAGTSYAVHSATPGTYDPTTGIWNIGTLAPNQRASLIISVIALQEGVVTNIARLYDMSAIDTNTSNNESGACVSVPVNLCEGQKMTFSVPSTYQNVRWYKNNVFCGPGNTIEVTQAGVYTFEAYNAECPASGCCPIVVTTTVCCPADACVPLSIQKVK